MIRGNRYAFNILLSHLKTAIVKSCYVVKKKVRRIIRIKNTY